MFAEHGLRLVARMVCWIGFAMSLVAIVTLPRSYQGLVYGVSRPVQRAAYGHARPYGPLVDPSDTACWLVMAIALGAGYLAMRTEERPARAGAGDTRAIWIAGAIATMFVALLASLSRSGAVGFLTAFLFGAGATASRAGRRGRLLLLAAGGVALTIAILIPRTDALASKFDSTRLNWSGGRLVIWQETLPIIRKFWVVGVGAGAYPYAMEVYQQSHLQNHFDEAHNQLLQIVTEGGLLAAVPAGLALVLIGVGAIRRLRSDRSPIYWIRLGAVAGLTGVLVQVLWTSSLARPANAMLAVMLSALAIHDRPRDRETAHPSPGRRTDDR